jgi:putative chitinase
MRIHDLHLGFFKRPVSSAPVVTPPSNAPLQIPVPVAHRPIVTPRPIVAPGPFGLTAPMLIAIGIDRARAAKWLGPLRSAMSSFQISTPARAAAFVAQITHESGRFVCVKELWGPTPAQKRYDPSSPTSEQLGNSATGDGLRFCGRGLIQITGRANYAACGTALGLNLVGEPALLEQPKLAALSAGWFWKSRSQRARRRW